MRHARLTPWLTNRFTITFGVLAIVIGLWNLYVVTYDTGRIAGRVVGPDGAPVPGATVRLAERTLLVTRPASDTTTDAAGRFLFEDHDLYRLYLAAEKPGLGEAPQREYRLYFKGQDLELDQPIQLREPSGS